MVNIIHYSLVVYYLLVMYYICWSICIGFLGLIILKIIYLQKVYL